MSEVERERWEARYVSEGVRLAEPTQFIVETVGRLQPAGSALDVAGGAGRNTMWLAQHGWDVTLVDISPTALELAEQWARDLGLTITTQCLDLESAEPAGGPWDLVVIAHYLNRAQLSRIGRLITPGGHLVMTHPTVENLARHDRPPRSYLLEPGELTSLLVGLEVVSCFEGWTSEERHESQVLARLPDR